MIPYSEEQCLLILLSFYILDVSQINQFTHVVLHEQLSEPEYQQLEYRLFVVPRSHT